MTPPCRQQPDSGGHSEHLTFRRKGGQASSQSPQAGSGCELARSNLARTHIIIESARNGNGRLRSAFYENSGGFVCPHRSSGSRVTTGLSTLPAFLRGVAGAMWAMDWPMGIG